MFSVDQLPFIVAARRNTRLGEARDTEFEQVAKVLNEAGPRLFSRCPGHEAPHGVLSLPDGPVQLTPLVLLQDSPGRIGGVLGDPCELERQAVHHGAVSACSGERDRTARSGFVQIGSCRLSQLGECVLRPAITRDPLPFAELRHFGTHLLLQLCDRGGLSEVDFADGVSADVDVRVTKSWHDHLALEIDGLLRYVSVDQIIPAHRDDSAVAHGHGLLDRERIVNRHNLAVVEQQIDGLRCRAAAQRHEGETQNQTR